MFYLAVVPTGLLMRALGHDPLETDSQARGRQLLAAPAFERELDERDSSDRGPMSLVGELWAFLRIRKKFWLLPLVVVLLAVGALIVLTQGSAIAPFIYTIF